jgi:hypothetical protein
MGKSLDKTPLPRQSRWPTAAQLLVAGLGAAVGSLLVSYPPHGGTAYGAAASFVGAVAGTTAFVLASRWNADGDPVPLFPGLCFVVPGGMVGSLSGSVVASVALAATTAVLCGVPFRAVKAFRVASHRKPEVGPNHWDPDL